MSRRRKAAAAILSMTALVAACEIAQAQPNVAAGEPAASAPAYTLEVESDAPDVVSYEALAARIGSDLGSSVARPGDLPALRAVITIRYRDRELVVRAVHAGGRVLERKVKAEGDAADVQREAVLLAANLARDEAREILDVLAARPSPAPAAAPEPTSMVEPSKPPIDEGYHPFSIALFSPLATNYARPNVRTNLNLSFVYGRVGTVDGMQLGGAVAHASRDVSGAQLGGAASVSEGAMDGTQLGGAIAHTSRDVSGAQLAGAVAIAGGTVDGVQIVSAVNVARGEVNGVQMSGALNLALEGMTGAQFTGAVNVTRGSFGGMQMSGAANIATRDVEGAQLSAVNVAGPLDGVQIGVLNVARKVRGAQVGVLNIAEEVDGVALGVVSISKNSIHPLVWTSNLQYMNAGIKFSTKYVYTLLGVHYGTLEGDFDNVGATAAIGGRLPLPARFDIELQNAVTHLVPRPSESTKNGNLWLAHQVIAGYSFASHLRIFAGGGARLPLSVDIGRDVVRPEVLAGIQF